MKGPDVVNVMLDKKRNVRYEILAYRRLTQEEMLDCVASYLRANKGKPPEKGQKIIITTLFGHDS